MPEYKLTDQQWCVLDLLLRAKEKGVPRLSRLEILNSPSIPINAKAQLVWAMLVMPSDLVTWHGEHEISVTAAGESLYRLRMGQSARPTAVADTVIHLPGPERYRN